MNRNYDLLTWFTEFYRVLPSFTEFYRVFENGLKWATRKANRSSLFYRVFVTEFFVRIDSWTDSTKYFIQWDRCLLDFNEPLTAYRVNRVLQGLIDFHVSKRSSKQSNRSFFNVSLLFNRVAWMMWLI